MMKTSRKHANPRVIRQQLGLNQQAFWSKVGVTQSGGSRYETGRAMPKPVRELLRLVHVEGIDLSGARGEHFAIARHLRSTNPGLYARLQQEVKDKKSRNGRKG